MNPLILTYHGRAQALAAWGLADPILTRRSRASGAFTCKLAGGDPASAPIFSYFSPITLTEETTGQILFIGRALPSAGRADPDSRNVTYQFADAWYDLEHLIYQMVWNVNDGRGNITTTFSSRVWLFQALGQGIGPGGTALAPWRTWTAAEQIIDIINFARRYGGVNLQPGEIDPTILLPVYPCRAITCAGAITTVLQTLPDAVTAIDYTTNPPSLHIVQRQNCKPWTLPWATPTSVKHKSSPSIKKPSRPANPRSGFPVSANQ